MPSLSAAFISFSDPWGNRFDLVRDHGPKLDQAVTALVEDLDERGMLDDVTVVVWGEFGRTPRINNNAGRDHWPRVSCALLAGGGMQTGQAIGSTTFFTHEIDALKQRVAELEARS